MEYYQGGQNTRGYDLEYNQAGQIIRKTEPAVGGGTTVYEYEYDDRGRLFEVIRDGVIVEAYAYDANGNRTLHTSTDAGIEAESARYTAGDQLQSRGNTTYHYDANGRLSGKIEDTEAGPALTTYLYSSEGQLLQVDTPEQAIEYRHNVLGQRVAKLVNGQVVEQYLWQDLITLLAVYDGSGNLKQRFEYTAGHTPTSFTQNGQRYYIQTDHLGSPRVITDSNGSVVRSIRYDSYGNITHDSDPEFAIPFGFAGGLHDSDTGLIRFGFRDYDPETGRWTARDPIGFAGGDTNLYGYVLGDPAGRVDPNGLRGQSSTHRPNPWNQHQRGLRGQGYTPAQIRTLYWRLKLEQLGSHRMKDLHAALNELPDKGEEFMKNELLGAECNGSVCSIVIESCECDRPSLSCDKYPSMRPMASADPKCLCTTSTVYF